jgi:hypothetical protein
MPTAARIMFGGCSWPLRKDWRDGMDDLIKWFAEEGGFSNGTKAPHKWVLQAEQELRIQAAALAEAQAEIALLKAENAGLKAAILALSKDATARAALEPREGEGT